MPIYTRSYLKSNVNGRIHNKIGKLTNSADTINNGVKEANDLVDFRSTKRRTLLAPNLFQDIYTYGCPTDMKGTKICDLSRQTPDRPRFEVFDLTTREEFDRYKANNSGLVAFADNDFIRKLLVSATISDQTLIASMLDSLTSGGGTWSAIGDATNLRVDSDNFVAGNGSLEFDLNSGLTTAGIRNTTLTVMDLTNYIAQGSVFVYVWITTADTNITGITIKIGTDTSNYYTRTVTVTNEGTSLQAGWNLIRFDFNGITKVASPTLTNTKYIDVYLNKSGAKPAETQYRFDNLQIKRGKYYNVDYYSKYPWQSAAGVYKELSTDDTDYINVDTDEYSIILEKCVELAALEAKEANDYSIAIQRFNVKSDKYRMDNPSEAKIIVTSRHDFSSIDGDDRTFGYQR